MVWGAAAGTRAQVFVTAGDVEVPNVSVGRGFAPNGDSSGPRIFVVQESESPIPGNTTGVGEPCFDTAQVGAVSPVVVGDMCNQTTPFESDVSLLHFNPEAQDNTSAQGLIVSTQPILGYSFTGDCLNKSDEHVNSAAGDAYPSNDPLRGVESNDQVFLGRNRHIMRLSWSTGEADALDQLRVFTKHIETDLRFRECDFNSFFGTEFSVDLQVRGSDGRQATLLVELPSSGPGCSLDGDPCEARGDVFSSFGVERYSCSLGRFDEADSELGGQLSCSWTNPGIPNIVLLGGKDPETLDRFDCRFATGLDAGVRVDAGASDAGVGDAGRQDAAADDAGPVLGNGTLFSGGAACSASSAGGTSTLWLLAGLLTVLMLRRRRGQGRLD